MKKIVVLISGSGSNLQALIDACDQQQIKGTIVAVISNKKNAYGITRAQQADIATHIIDHTTYASRESFDEAVQAVIDTYSPDLVVLAGYMRILTPAFVQHYLGRLLNIHPSLLPKYPGLHTHQRAMDAGDSEHGTTVHFVTEELDGGPIILQAKVPIFPDDIEQDVINRVLHQEHSIYPLVVKWFCDDRLSMKQGKAYLDDKCIATDGYGNDE